MKMDVSSLVGDIKAKKAIGADDVLALRKTVWPDGIIGRDEAETLFEINDLDAQTSEEWTEFFVNAINEYLVNQEFPEGYISEDNAAWLFGRVDHDGKVESRSELELLVRVMEKATGTPESLQNYVLKQIEDAVMTGNGPTRDGGELRPGCITDAEVEILRRLLFAPGSSGPGRIDRTEADMLFRIKDATLGAENSVHWPKRFVQMVGNYLMAYGEYEAFTRDEAAHYEKFMNDNKPSVGGFFNRMKGSNIGKAFKEVFGTGILSGPNAACGHINAVEAARELDSTENAWLHQQIHADGNLDELEGELLDFIADELG